MLRKIYFVVDDSFQYPFLKEIVRTICLNNKECYVIQFGRKSNSILIKSALIKIISNFESKISNKLKCLKKECVEDLLPNDNIGNFTDSFFINLCGRSIPTLSQNGNVELILKAYVNDKPIGAFVEDLVWCEPKDLIVIKSYLVESSGIGFVTEYTTSNNTPFLTSRVNNMIGVMYDILFYSIMAKA